MSFIRYTFSNGGLTFGTDRTHDYRLTIHDFTPFLNS